MDKKRIEYIDILKVIGLLCIILAHVDAPSTVSMIRTFDVVLLIMISGYLGLKYYKNINFKEYSLKRFKRLVLPTWIFLTFFFIICVFMKVNVNFELLFLSYSLSNYGIGYVWIIRIYLLMALLIPLYKYVIVHVSKIKIFVVLLIMFAIHELLCMTGIFDFRILNYLFAYIIPCFFLLYISNFIFEMNQKKLFIVSFISLVLCALIGYILYVKYGSFQSPQIMKYPFRTYYLTYGITVSSLLICIVRNDRITKLLYNKFVRFVSMHSLWIYLWHILAIFILKRFAFTWFINYLLIVLFAIIITFIQSVIVKNLKKVLKKSDFLKVFEG